MSNTVYIYELDFIRLVQATMNGVRLLRDEEGKKLGPEPRADCENQVSTLLRSALSIAYGGDAAVVVHPYGRAWGDSSAHQGDSIPVRAIGDDAAA